MRNAAVLPLAAAVALLSAVPVQTNGVAWLLVGAPLAEELVFRAGLQAWLERRIRAAGAVLVTSLAFAACHLTHAPVGWAAATFLPSLALGALYARTARLAPCVALHMVFNAVWCFGAAPLLAGWIR